MAPPAAPVLLDSPRSDAAELTSASQDSSRSTRTPGKDPVLGGTANPFALTGQVVRPQISPDQEDPAAPDATVEMEPVPLSGQPAPKPLAASTHSGDLRRDDRPRHPTFVDTSKRVGEPAAPSTPRTAEINPQAQKPVDPAPRRALTVEAPARTLTELAPQRPARPVAARPAATPAAIAPAQPELRMPATQPPSQPERLAVSEAHHAPQPTRTKPARTSSRSQRSRTPPRAPAKQQRDAAAPKDSPLFTMQPPVTPQQEPQNTKGASQTRAAANTAVKQAIAAQAAAERSTHNDLQAPAAKAALPAAATRPTTELRTPLPPLPSLLTPLPPMPQLARMLPPSAIEDPSLRVALHAHVARMLVDTGDGSALAVEVKVKDGVADLRADGEAAKMLHAREGELRLALAGEGISLGRLDVSADGSRSGGSQREQPHDTPGRYETPRPPQSTHEPGPSRPAGRMHVKA